MLYPNNFDDSGFQAVNRREFNKSIDDPCAIQQREQDNNKKLKFITTNHRDLLDAKKNLNFYGMTVKDQLFVPADRMDTFSELRQGQSGNILTNCNVKNEYGQLPFPTMPSRYQMYHGDVDKEDSMRYALLEANRKTCNPLDTQYFERYFYIFDDKSGVEKPNALKTIQTPELGPRGGISTRFVLRKK